MGDGVFEQRPSGGIMPVLDTRKVNATALQYPPNDGGGSNRVVGTRLDLDQDPQASFDEAAVDEGPRVRNRAQPGFDRDPPGDQ